MDGIASFLSYGQPIPLDQSIEELQHSLLCTTLELKSAQLAVVEEKRRNEETIKQLLQHLQVASQERDEAKDRLQRLLNKITQSAIYPPCYVPHSNPESSPLIPTKGNSSVVIVESDVPSSVDSLFGAVSPSSDLPNMNIANSKNMEILQEPFIHEHGTSASIGRSSALGQVDPASAIIDRLVVSKALPVKGKMLQAVMESGPLLQTLLLAGPLPQWRNPPPPQLVQIPPISITGHDSSALLQKPVVDPIQHVRSTPIASCYENSEGKTQTCSTSFFNFSSAVGSCMKKHSGQSSGIGNELCHNPTLKRRRVK